MKKIFSIFGPTGIGKSSLAIELAKKIDGEIIGVDSRQIYNGIPIGTAQPDCSQLNEVPHHLIGFKKLNEKISAGEYIELIDNKIDKIIQKNKFPILCGGTGLYFKSLKDGIFEGSHTDDDIRSRLEQEYEIDKEKLFKSLQKIDPDYSNKVHINNKKRLIRALEVFETTGKPMSENFDSSSKNSRYANNFYFVYLKMHNDLLHPRILKRIQYMIDDGMIDEVKEIIKRKINISHIDYIGFKEISSFLNKEISINEAIENIFVRTRQYAKRQKKWFNVNAYDISFDLHEVSKNDIVDKLIQIN
ncbi:MAG: tRNA (adenosine(37)-N6)-dimethylallyltransferase MiaA [Candidatus Marinimicrobia bacterium]|nr:tRNA (adenosine(37)-N6)-dimethylallyltransferase MiaA [Candidatus Neomarinimicrobiota bacterium]